MATDNSTPATNGHQQEPSSNIDTSSIAREAIRANMVFLAIQEVAEAFEFNSGDEDVFELARQALTIIGLSRLGCELTNKILTCATESEAHHA